MRKDFQPVNIALLRLTRKTERQCLRAHDDAAFRHRNALGHGLGGHIDHMRFARLGEMREVRHSPCESHGARGARRLALQ